MEPFSWPLGAFPRETDRSPHRGWGDAALGDTGQAVRPQGTRAAVRAELAPGASPEKGAVPRGPERRGATAPSPGAGRGARNVTGVFR